jgi:hypothetical protein
MFTAELNTMKALCKIIVVLIVFLIILLVPLNLVNWIPLNLINLYMATFALLASLVAIFGQYIREWLLGPILEIAPDEKYIKFIDGASTECERLWIRAKITNRGWSTAKNCYCRLEEIANPETKDPIKKNFEKVFLPWVGFPKVRERRTELGRIEFFESHGKEYLSFDIPRKSDAFADIAKIENKSGSSIINLVTSIEWPTDLVLFPQRKEKSLAVKIIVFGDNFTPVKSGFITINSSDLDIQRKNHIE